MLWAILTACVIQLPITIWLAASVWYQTEQNTKDLSEIKPKVYELWYKRIAKNDSPVGIIK